METASERRKRKLQWVADHHGGIAAVAEEAGINAASLDQVLKGTLLPRKADGTRSPRSLGDAAARKIEDRYKLGRAWFDAPEPVKDAADSSVQMTTKHFAMFADFLALDADRQVEIAEQIRAEAAQKRKTAADSTSDVDDQSAATAPAKRERTRTDQRGKIFNVRDEAAPGIFKKVFSQDVPVQPRRGKHIDLDKIEALEDVPRKGAGLLHLTAEQKARDRVKLASKGKDKDKKG